MHLIYKNLARNWEIHLVFIGSFSDKSVGKGKNMNIDI